MSNNTTAQDFHVKLLAFIDLVQKKANEYYASQFPTLTPPTFSVDIGPKFVRIVRTDSGTAAGRSVWGFVQKSNGDILKAAGWKAPAKHARGSIFNQDPWEGMGVYGPHYMK